MDESYTEDEARKFRTRGFLGIMNPENDAVYLSLKKGANELVLAVSELGGGWGSSAGWWICKNKTTGY